MSYTLTSNSPASGSIAWSGVSIAYNGTEHTITDGNTAHGYVWWKLATPTVFHASASEPDDATLTDDGFLVFFNDSGNAECFLDDEITGSRIAPLAITETHIADDSISTPKIQAGAVLTSNLEVQLRPIDFVGVTFSASASNPNVMIWTSVTPGSSPITYGTATYEDEAGASVTVLIKPNLTGIAYAGLPLYVYFDPTASYTDAQGRLVNDLKWTTDRSLARNKSTHIFGSNILMASFHGRGSITSVFGGVTISGDTITAGSIKGDRIIAGELLAQHIAASEVFVDQDFQIGTGAQRVRLFQGLPAFNTATWINTASGIAVFTGNPGILVGDPEDAVQKSTVYIGLDEGDNSNGTPVPVIWFGAGGGVERLRIGKLTSSDYGIRVKSRVFSDGSQYTLFDSTDTLASLWPNDFSVNGNVSAWADKTVLGKYASSNSSYVSNYALSLSAGWLSDVSISAPSSGNAIIWNASTSKWINAAPFYAATTATSAAAGSSTLPASPAGFITTTVGSATVKIPYYNA